MNTSRQHEDCVQSPMDKWNTCDVVSCSTVCYSCPHLLMICCCLSQTDTLVVGSRPSDHYFRSVCWFVRLFVCLCRVFLSRLWSDFDQARTCYMSGSSCVLWNIGAVRPLGAGWPRKTCIFRGFGAQKNISSYSFDRNVLILLILYNTPILKFSRAIFCNFHLEPKL